MNADVFSIIGASHRICQDYTSCQSTANNAIAVVSDGCSSVADTDFGSRFLIRAVQVWSNCLGNFIAPNRDKIPLEMRGVINLAQSYCHCLNFDDDVLCATLLWAATGKDHFQVACAGDGAIAAVHNDGSIHVIEYEFPSGAPYYLRYNLDEEMLQGYFDQFGGACQKITYVISSGHVSDLKVIDFNLTPDNSIFAHEFPLSDFRTVAVFSDGVRSFITARQESIKSSVIIKELMAFKNYTGSFVHRRCQRAFKNYREAGTHNFDDVSMAVLTQEK